LKREVGLALASNRSAQKLRPSGFSPYFKPFPEFVEKNDFTVYHESQL